MWRTLLVVAILDLNSYCKGVCQSRYQDGAYINGKCACIDYQPVNVEQRYEVPKHPRKKGKSEYYDGADEMHYAPSD